MSDAVQQTIALVQQQIAELEADLIEKKRMVNSLRSLIKQEPIYTDEQLVTTKASGTLQPDAYYGQPLASAVRMVLERRKANGAGPTTANEIYDSLLEGGYKFNTSNDEHAKRGLYAALSKNTATFHKLPNGLYGLLEWYPGAREPKPAKAPKAAGGTQPQLRIDDISEDEFDFAAREQEANNAAK
ncbi:hypothetical protein ETAA8_68350 [Anatilimnocola aggregata]|uniref:HTH HARE-type domain-containing protein n=1 Tax=Anatilimnocola aggregata TaxID=2528021 RepID=A0A517YN84_9BACT|nr:hypothetical protein [Anatilimnocola aggregata]QDU31675.1 hypothetical protein ETAA8_68350 [Anatilimnocola aggregata]